MGGFSAENLPCIATWVTVVGPDGSLGTSGPALVSAVADDSVTVVYPGPGNTALFNRVPGIRLQQLQPSECSEAALDEMERRFLLNLTQEPLAEIPAVAGAQRAVMKMHDGCIAAAGSRASVVAAVKAALLGAEEGQAKARASLRRSLCAKSPAVATLSAPCTPPGQNCRARSSSPQTPTCRRKAKKEALDGPSAPCTPPKSTSAQRLARSQTVTETTKRARKTLNAGTNHVMRDEKARFTLAVSRELGSSGCSEAALPRKELEAKLLKDFDMDAIHEGLQLLDELNKITLMDDMVYRV